MEQLKNMKQTLVSCIQGQMSHLDSVDTKELGEVVDMVKDLSEAIYYCTITEAMEGKDKKSEEHYHHYTQNYYTRDMDRNNGRMYYSEIPMYYNEGNSSSNSSMNYSELEYPMMRDKTYQTVGWNNRIRPVSSIEEVRAASIDFDGSVFYFSDLANKKIYTKQINLDGTAQLNMYELKETPVMEQPIVDTSNFVTRTEFDNVINYLKNFLIAPQSDLRESAAAGDQAESEPVNQGAVPAQKREFKF